eukprot:6194656-Pleurochrysis_carterae.AAC.3
MSSVSGRANFGFVAPVRTDPHIESQACPAVKAFNYLSVDALWLDNKYLVVPLCLLAQVVGSCLDLSEHQSRPENKATTCI